MSNLRAVRVIWIRKWILFTFLCIGSGWVNAGNGSPISDKQSYDATCDFIVDEIKRLDKIISQEIGEDELLKNDIESGARAYLRRGAGIYIEYVVTIKGKKIISRAELGQKYFSHRLNAKSLKNKLRLSRDFRHTLQTGCDRYELTVKKNGSRIKSVTITADID